MLKALILQYFNAFSNFYGIISMKKAYRIIEKQNPELNLTKTLFAEITDSLDLSNQRYVIWSEDEVYDEAAEASDLFDKLLIADYIVTFNDPNDYEQFVLEQGDRPYYVPPKDELLKYDDDFYYEKTKHNYSLENFLRDDLKLSNYEEIVDDFASMLVIDEIEPDYAIASLKRMGRPVFKEFANKQEAEKFLRLLINIRNHTRKHTHRGHTPYELNDCLKIDQLLEESMPVGTNPPSKNGKCPCGSGKKFKRCCMGKGIYD